MSDPKAPDNKIKPPDDSLSNYFADLLDDHPLGGDSSLEKRVAVGNSDLTAVAANASGAQIRSLPTKHTQRESIERRARRSEPVLTPSRAISPFAEPDPVQTPEQKRQLEKLLQSARTQLLIPTPVITDANTDTHISFSTQKAEIQEWDIGHPLVDIATVDTAVAVPQPASEHAVATATPHFQIAGLEWLANGRPQWAQSRFDVLLFKVSGLTLAVPLISLGQIQLLTEELTPLFGQADWFMGLQPTAAGKIRTVNTAKFVMPERYDENFLTTAKYVVSINGVPWGLAVDSVNQPISLLPDDIKWRSERSKRPWLAGTVKAHMCALLDVPRIGQMLIEADKNFVPA